MRRADASLCVSNRMFASATGQKALCCIGSTSSAHTTHRAYSRNLSPNAHWGVKTMTSNPQFVAWDMSGTSPILSQRKWQHVLRDRQGHPSLRDVPMSRTAMTDFLSLTKSIIETQPQHRNGSFPVDSAAGDSEPPHITRNRNFWN